MAQIMHASLQIIPINPLTSKVNVTVRTRYTHLELAKMQTGLKFRLDCNLMGKDIPPNPDDDLFAMQTKLYPDATPSANESHTFSVDVPKHLFDEDDEGTEQIFAKVTLRNMPTGETISKNTNVIVMQL